MLLSFIMDVARNAYSEPKGGFSKPLVLEELKRIYCLGRGKKLPWILPGYSLSIVQKMSKARSG